MKTWATILTFVIIRMLIWLFSFQDDEKMFCTASVQKIFYHHGVLRRTSTVSRLQTWCWSILQIFVSILVNVLVNVQRLQVGKDAVDFEFHVVVVEYFAIISSKFCAPPMCLVDAAFSCCNKSKCTVVWFWKYCKSFGINNILLKIPLTLWMYKLFSLKVPILCIGAPPSNIT